MDVQTVEGRREAEILQAQERYTQNKSIPMKALRDLGLTAIFIDIYDHATADEREHGPNAQALAEIRELCRVGGWIEAEDMADEILAILDRVKEGGERAAGEVKALDPAPAGTTPVQPATPDLAELAAEMRQWVTDCCYGAQSKYRADMARDVWAWAERLSPDGAELNEDGLNPPPAIGQAVNERLKTTQEKRDAELRMSLQIVDRQMQLTEGWICNGCSCGYKPACDCPNPADVCDRGASHRAWKRIIAIVKDGKP